MNKTITPEMVRERLEAAYSTLDIPAEIERHIGIRLHPVSRSGKQYGGACPYSDCSVDTDGFSVWPELTPRGRHYYCRGCKRSGDILKLVQDINGLSFSEACQVLGLPNPYLNGEKAGKPFSKPQVKRRMPNGEQWQLDELQSLYEMYPRAKLALRRDRARAYLEARAIPFDLAIEYGLGYIPALSEVSQVTPELKKLQRWCDRIIFPLLTPDERVAYCGRTLFLWEPGMDEDEHKRRIDAYNLQMKERSAEKALWYQMPRWKYTYQQGFFNWQATKTFEEIAFVEGPFDVMACLASGVLNAVSIGTTGLDGNQLPLTISSVVLGLDMDGAGSRAAKSLATSLRRKGIDVEVCTPVNGKDWSAAYRLDGAQGLAPLVGAMAKRLVCHRCGISNSLSSEAFHHHSGSLLCSHCLSFTRGEEDKDFLTDLGTGEGVCSVCLDLDPRTETPTRYALGDFLYCEEHHPQRQALRAFTDALTAQCSDLQTCEIYHASQRAEVKRRVLEEWREHEGAEQRRLQDETQAKGRQASTAKR